MNNWDTDYKVKTNSDLLSYLRTFKISPNEAFALIHKQKFKSGRIRDWQLCKYRIYIDNRILDFVAASKKLRKIDKKAFLSKFPRAKSIQKAVNSKNYEIAFKIYNPKKKFDVDRKRLEVKNLEKLIPCKSQNLLFDPSILSDVSSFSSMNRGRRMRWINFLR